MEYLSVGEKIKRLRREIGLRQDALTNNEITRSLISMVENNKRTLTNHSAQVIAESLNKYYKSFGKTITAEYLLETKEDQVSKTISSKIKDLEDRIEDNRQYGVLEIESIFKETTELSAEWSLKRQQAEIQFLRGRYYYKSQHYHDALRDLSTALMYFMQQREYTSTLNTLEFIGLCYQGLTLYEEALVYYNIANNILLENEIDNIELKQHNLSLIIECYIKIRKFDMALQYIILFKELPLHTNGYYFMVQYYEAISYREIGNYNKSEKIYEGLMEKSAKLSKDLLIDVYKDFSKLSKAMGNLGNSLKYFDLALKTAEEYSSEVFFQLTLEKSELFMEYKMINEAMAILDTLDFNIKTPMDKVIDLYLRLGHLQLQKGNYNQAMDYLKRIEAFIQDGKYKDKERLYNCLNAEIYAKTGEDGRCIEYIRKLGEIED